MMKRSPVRASGALRAREVFIVQAHFDDCGRGMFTGLFIVVHAFQIHVMSQWGMDGWGWLDPARVDRLSVISAALSNLVSDVPAVLLMEPIMRSGPSAGQETAWLALAMSSTLA